MKLKCDYCDGYYTELDENCPHCGAVNPMYKRQGNEVPRTIEELQQWYVDHHLPPKEVTRFFIGENCHEARAFGIYRDGERVIVYKNKGDGTRAVRYDGNDEAYAVNELYMKLKEEIMNQKSANSARRGRTTSKKKKKSPAFGIVVTIIIIAIGLIISFFETSNGYYRYGGNQYYYLENTWYLYDAVTNSWGETSVDSELSNNADDYYESSSYDSSYGTSDFSDTSYYSEWQETHSNDSSWDSGSDWSSSDSWDSGSSDWGSDW